MPPGYAIDAFSDLYSMDSICHHRGVEPTLVLFAAIGVVSGVITSLAGVGGATFSTAGVRAAGTAPSFAIGSTLPAVLPSAVAGSIRYARAGLVDWRSALTTGLSGAVLAVAGALTSRVVDAHMLMLVTALILGASGVGLLRSYRTATDGGEAGSGEGPAAPGTTALLAVGGVSGFVAGLLGLGGGLIVVPAFTRFLRMPLRTAVGSSLVAVAVLSVPAVVAQSLLGNIDWWIALALVAGVVPGARMGSRLALLASEATIAKVCGGLLVLLAALQAVTEVSSLLG
jgi:uncharacterized membrane protein YfcA